MDNLTVTFLGNAVKLLKKNRSSDKINSVINQLRFKSLDFLTCSPSEINQSKVCVRCGNVWQDGLFSLQVKCHKNNKIRKRIKKFGQETKLTPCRKDFLSYYKSQKDNIMIKKCSVCKSVTKYSMSKPSSSVNKENVNLQYVENQNSQSRKRKRKSGKKQSFAGLSPVAVFQARLSSCNAKVEDNRSLANDVSKIREPVDVNSLEVSRFVKNSKLLSGKEDKPCETATSITIAQTVSQSDITLDVPQVNIKKQKLKNGGLTVSKKKSKKKKKKSFLSEVLSIL